MTNKDLMQALGYMKSLLYRCMFRGDQIVVVAECLRTIENVLQKINDMPPEQRIDTVDKGGAV